MHSTTLFVVLLASMYVKRTCYLTSTASMLGVQSQVINKNNLIYYTWNAFSIEYSFDHTKSNNECVNTWLPHSSNENTNV